MLRLVTWNLRHGGGPRRMPAIALALVELEPDLVVLTEYRASVGGQIRGALADRGLTHAATTGNPAGTNGILIASRWAIHIEPPAPPNPPDPPHSPGVFERFPGRFLDVRVPAFDLRVTGVHVPDDSRLADKAAFWRGLIHMARDRSESPWLVLGDFNSGREGLDSDSAFRLAQLLGTFQTLGMEDCWRRLNPGSREVSWVGPVVGAGAPSWAIGAGRIDAAFASKPLHGKAQRACFVQGPREEGVSDHAPLVVEMDVGPARAEGPSPSRGASVFG